MALLSNAVLNMVLDLAHHARSSNQFIMDLRLGSNGSTASDASPLSPATLPFLVDSMLWLATQTPAVIDLALPATCLETAVDASTNAECDGILSYLDSRIAEFKRPGGMPKSHHTLLRTCTLMLRRLSKSQDASLCGRVLLFLAKFLPLTERSGVNLSGAFHVENLTPVEDVPEESVDAEGRPVDAQFYATFWGLQKWFADPPAVLGAGKWAEVSRGVRTVLDKFSSEKVTVTENAQSDVGSAATGGTSVKYLSSARLLPLQLRDAAFRRHFLVQALVLMAWVEHPLLKDWADKGAKGRTLEDLEDLRAKVFATLESTPEKGKEFADAVRGVLSGEAAWATWKQAGCPPEPLQVAPLVIPPEAATIELGPPRKRPRHSPDATYGICVGTDELDRLWNLTEDNLSTLGADDRGGFKTLRQLMEPVIDEMNEEPGETDEEMKASKNSSYSWKTLRLMARDSLPAFAASVRAGGDLTVAARALYPDEVPPAPAIEAEKVKVEVASRPETPAVTAGVPAGDEGEGGKLGEGKEESVVVEKADKGSEQMETDAEKDDGGGVDEEMPVAVMGGDESERVSEQEGGRAESEEKTDTRANGDDA